MKETEYCKGCKDDFYNANNNLGIDKCWLLDTAKIVTLYKIGWWTPPDSKANFTKIKTYNCHHASGIYALYTKLPDHLIEDEEKASP